MSFERKRPALLFVACVACGGGSPDLVADGADGDGASADGAPGEGEIDAAPLSCTTEVGDVAGLVDAIGGLGPGVTICLAPGTYLLPERFVLGAERSGAPGAPATIAARDGLDTVTIDAGGAESSFQLSGARDLAFRGLRITGGGYHGIKIDPPSGDVLIVDSVFFDNTRGTVNAQYSDVKGCCLVDRVTIERSEFYQEAAFAGDNYQAIDCNGCKGWVVRGNHLHDLVANGFVVAIQFKSGSADTIIEDNLIRDVGIGISLGGFGNPPLYGEEEHEHLRGIVRNNVIHGCVDAGITAIDTVDGTIVHNTLWDNGFTPDVRVRAENLQVKNNLFDRALNLRDGTDASEAKNVVVDDPALFVSAATGDFHLAPGAAAALGAGVDLGELAPLDFEGDPRGAAPDVGADERP